jgi:hypothetical protein
LREISAELAKRGYLNERGKPFNAMSIKNMVEPHMKLTWSGDEKNGWLGVGDGVAYTIQQPFYASDLYETRSINLGPEHQIDLTKPARRLAGQAQRLSAGVRGNISYVKPAATLEEAKAQAERDYAWR